jgi:hypothetical protein
VAIGIDRAGAVAVAEHAPVHFAAEFAHLAAFLIVRELEGLAV